MKSGIYQFRNVVTNTIYIGSAINLVKRKNRHIRELRLNKHHSIKFQRSFNKYGENCFEYNVLEYIDNIDNLINREQFYLNDLLSANINNNLFDTLALNTSRFASSTLGTKRSINSKLKMSLSAKKRFEVEDPWNKGKIGIYTQDTLESMSISKKGKNLSPEHREKVIRNLKKTSGPLSEITKGKISKSKLGQGSKPILQFDLSNNFIKEFSSIGSASIECNITRSNISACCRSKQNKAGGYIWKYKD